jgi:hypothetical protein
MKARCLSSLALSLVLAAAATPGCSTKAWYEALKFSARNECNRQPPGESERCLSQVSTMSYEEYERSRSGAKQWFHSRTTARPMSGSIISVDGASGGFERPRAAARRSARDPGDRAR